MNLREFLDTNRDEILARMQVRIAARAPVATEMEMTQGIAMFLDPLIESPPWRATGKFP